MQVWMGVCCWKGGQLHFHNLLLMSLCHAPFKVIEKCGSYPFHCANKSNNTNCNEMGFQDFMARKSHCMSLQMQLPAVVLMKSWVLCSRRMNCNSEAVLDVTIFVGSSSCWNMCTFNWCISSAFQMIIPTLGTMLQSSTGMDEYLMAVGKIDPTEVCIVN